MFDIGFSELLLIAVIGLLVLARTAAHRGAYHLAVGGRLRRQFNQIRVEVEREIGADEIRAQLRNESILEDLRQSRAALESSAPRNHRAAPNHCNPPASVADNSRQTP
ncbi:MAG: twin-arginine translocase subunit TatB [Gammaproteobacteria bacterium]|nr:twin-arginine translocase subunit TatB [Gammaproteobacteria bacterium]